MITAYRPLFKQEQYSHNRFYLGRFSSGGKKHDDQNNNVTILYEAGTKQSLYYTISHYFLDQQQCHDTITQRTYTHYFFPSQTLSSLGTGLCHGRAPKTARSMCEIISSYTRFPRAFSFSNVLSLCRFIDCNNSMP